MFSSHFTAAFRELLHRPAFAATVIGMLAVGISVPGILISFWNLLVRDPAPGRSELLHHVQMDHWHTRQEWDKDHQRTRAGEPPEQITFIDARGLIDSISGSARTAFYEADTSANSVHQDVPQPITLAAVHADFFSMMGAPLTSGSPWTRDEDVAHSRVAVISSDVRGRLFPDTDPVGQQIVLSGTSFRVVGVLSNWRPSTKFFAATIYGRMNDVYVPFDTAIEMQFSPSSPVRCSLAVATALPELEQSECAWIQLWVLLKEPTEAGRLLDHLNSYVLEQKKLGRFPRPLNNKVLNARQWVNYVQGATGMSSVLVPATALAVALLIATVSNAIALLLAKLSRGTHHVALRRAIGASRRDILLQHSAEGALIGTAAALVGLGISLSALHLARMQLEEFFRSYGFSLEPTATLDWELAGVFATLGLSCALVAVAYPAWRASRINPARLLNRER